MKGRHKNQTQVPKLTDVTTYQEAVQTLNLRRAPSIFKKTLDLLFKIDTSQPAGKTYQKQGLQEMENELKKHEDEEKDNSISETEHENDNGNGNGEKKENPFGETEGNPSSGKEHPHPDLRGGKEGVTAQADGGSVDDQIDTANDTGEGSEPAQAQPGESQLKEAIDQVADMGTVDPRATSVIDYMSDGMSQVQANNAAVADEKMMEAVFNVQFKKLALPLLRAALADQNRMQEIIRVVDKKHEGKKPTGGYSETVVIPQQVEKSSKKLNRFEETTPEEIKKDITTKYLSDLYS